MAIFGWLIDIMSNSLEFLYGITGNYGWAIVIFTIIIKALLFPLTAKQTKSMKKMQDIQPDIKALQEKYKDNKEKQQQEMMKLYKEKGVNPAGGCLPMIFTLIIIFPLYRAIYGLNMDNTTFLWIQNLAEPDVALVIVNGIAMAAQTYITTKVSGNTNSNNMMMWIMPVFILFIGFSLPAGVLIYWLTQTILTGLQQYILNKEPEVKGVAE